MYMRRYKMTYVRTRKTKADTVSTALIEAYRDDRGRPRQRVLANLHGEPDTLSALAKLAAMRDDLRKELTSLVEAKPGFDEVYEVVTTRTLQGHVYSASDRREIDKGLRQRERMGKRILEIEDRLKAIGRDGVVIKKHCTATPDEIQAAIKAFQKKHHDAECLVLGMEFRLKDAKATLLRMQR
jgi:hypothetical protein